MAHNIPDVVMASADSDAKEIDEGLYSRQLAVFGTEAQRRMQGANVLLVGLKGVGVEIAKNVILAGVKSVGLLDNDPVELRDLSSQFYLTPEHIGHPRAEASFHMLQSLNSYVKTHLVHEKFSTQLLATGAYQVVVVTGRPLKEQLAINDYCHQQNIKFISADINGVMGRVFCDFGEHHVVSDPDGERPLRAHITHVSRGNPGVVTVSDDARHGLQTGDWVTFEEIEGMTELNSSKPRQITVVGPYSFSIEDTTSYGEYTGEGYFNQVKMPVNVKHERLGAVLAHVSEKALLDVWGRTLPLHCIYQGMYAFFEKHGHLPQAVKDDQVTEAASLAKQSGASLDPKVDVDEGMAARLLRGSAASISPLAAIVGGIAGQEVLKACSGKFTPINQLFYFDAESSLPKDPLPASEYAPLNSRYDDQIAVFGHTIQNRLHDLSYFLIGAGAIGCEMLKNWAMMGVATRGGKVTVTDMDRIEKSNLNRQFLFRSADVNKLKSEAAAAAVLRMNPELHIVAHAEKVGVESEHLYDDKFWEGLDAVTTALDNVDARLYVDQRCIYYQKPMVDSGTQGTKGNTQVVVPFLTESYGSSRDPPEQGIPICTLKNFPNQIEHTIQWARDMFEGLFTSSPAEVNQYLSNPQYVADLESQPNTQLEKLRILYQYLVEEKPLTFEACIVWGRLLFEREFSHKIRQLLHVFPPDATTSSGTKFWSGKKRAPAPVSFDANDPTHQAFVISAANLRAFNYGLKGDRNWDSFRTVLEKVVVPPFELKSVKIAASDEEAKKMEEEKAMDDNFEQELETLQSKLPAPAEISGYQLYPADFEKDDDSNFHMDFITACSNLRARNYRIKEENKLNTKFIAGKIIPAIATTTALVTGLVCLELLKVLQKKPLTDYRNTYANLAVNLFTSSEPFEPAKTKAMIKSGEWKWSLWDRIDVDVGDITLQELFNLFKERYGLDITMLSYGSMLLYYDFGMPAKKKQERLQQRLTEIISIVSKTEIKPSAKVFALEVCVQDENGNDVDVPYMRYRFRH